jgi:Mg-chelatase subunit ChlI
LMDRFGLRAIVRGLTETEQRFQAYQLAISYNHDPDKLAAAYAAGTLDLVEEIEKARERLPSVTIGDDARDLGLNLVQSLKIDSNRAEITLFEAARAHAAADEREVVEPVDIQAVAVLALRQRQSPSLAKFFQEQAEEDDLMQTILAKHVK